jgi:hypothetical protein
VRETVTTTVHGSGAYLCAQRLRERCRH